MKVSVIIPTYNRKIFLEIAVNSVLKQSFQDFELLVVDDGSNDGTAKVLSKFNSGVKYIYQKNRGVSAARNCGIKNASGELIAFLDSDDRWDRKKLEIQSEFMDRNPDCLVSHTEEIWYRQGKLLNPKKKHAKSSGQIFDKCLPLCAVSISTAMARSELFDQVGLFDESLPVCEDYDFWLRTSSRFKILLIPQYLTLKDGGRQDQLSQQFHGMDRFRIQALLKLINSGTLNNPQHQLALRELQRKCKIYAEGALKRGKHKEASKYLVFLKNFC